MTTALTKTPFETGEEIARKTRSTPARIITDLARDSFTSAHLDAYAKAVCAIGDASDAVTFAREIYGFDLSICESKILDEGSLVDIFEYARDVTGADIHACEQAVIDSPDRGKEMIAEMFIAHVPGTDAIALQEALDAREARW